MKVKILVQNAQTRMTKPGKVIETNDKTGKHWIKNKWAKRINEKRK
jgi:hypothetical protein